MNTPCVSRIFVYFHKDQVQIWPNVQYVDIWLSYPDLVSPCSTLQGRWNKILFIYYLQLLLIILCILLVIDVYCPVHASYFLHPYSHPNQTKRPGIMRPGLLKIIWGHSFSSKYICSSFVLVFYFRYIQNTDICHNLSYKLPCLCKTVTKY